jgi:dUTP pyrophosphatase
VDIKDFIGRKKPLSIKVTSKREDLLPSYASEHAAGADIRANISDPMIIRPGERGVIPTGLEFEIPPGFEIQIRPRSGLAAKHGITVLNSPGTIDADYRGEVSVILINLGTSDFMVTPLMRMAQIVVAPVTRAQFILSESLAQSARGAGGFGHSGTH